MGITCLMLYSSAAPTNLINISPTDIGRSVPLDFNSNVRKFEVRKFATQRGRWFLAIVCTIYSNEVLTREPPVLARSCFSRAADQPEIPLAVTGSALTALSRSSADINSLVPCQLVEPGRMVSRYEGDPSGNGEKKASHFFFKSSLSTA